jgi:hypothetical protein
MQELGAAVWAVYRTLGRVLNWPNRLSFLLLREKMKSKMAGTEIRSLGGRF